MSLRLKSACVLLLWLTLFAFDFADDTGLIDDVQEDVDRSVDAALEDFGQALQSSDASKHLIALDYSIHSPPLAPAFATFLNLAFEPLVSKTHCSAILEDSPLYNKLRILLL
jgi:hypothetical protein